MGPQAGIHSPHARGGRSAHFRPGGGGDTPQAGTRSRQLAVNLQNHAYIAAKFLRWPHLIKSLFPLIGGGLLLAIGKRDFALIRKPLGGLILGLRQRKPVPKQLSSLYAADWPYFRLRFRHRPATPEQTATLDGRDYGAAGGCCPGSS